MKNILSIIVFFVISTSCISQETIRLIAQQDFPVDSLTKYEVVGLFLQKTRKIDRHPIKIVQYRTESSNRALFAKEFLSMSGTEESLYWRTQLVSVGMRPPKTKKNERIVHKYLLRHSSCVGYITHLDKLPNGLKQIRIKE